MFQSSPNVRLGSELGQPALVSIIAVLSFMILEMRTIYGYTVMCPRARLVTFKTRRSVQFM
jgi:hypothetical protein